MARGSIILDANLLALLIVGLARPDLVGQHKRVKRYSLRAYDLLAERLTLAANVVVTPNTLTEASNLLARGLEPDRGQIMATLQAFIRDVEQITGRVGVVERYLPSTAAAARSEFIRLGLADSVALEASTKDTTLLTDDLELYHAALDCGQEAEYFTYALNAAGIL